MTWCNEGDVGGDAVMETSSPRSNQLIHNEVSKEKWIKSCPSCGYKFQWKEQKKSGMHELPGLPAGVKFDPTDPELLEHLEGKVRMKTSKLHPLIDDFIPTLEGEDGICYTHPEQLPGVNKDGQVRHFFHCPSRAYTTGTRKRRKVQSNNENGGNGAEMRWHKTGKTRPVYVNGKVKGYKKILVLYTNYGRHKKPEKTNWVMHQYHLGSKEEETDGEFVVSKVFFQIQPRQCSSINKDFLLIRSNMQDRCDQHKFTTSNDLISYDSSLMSIIAQHHTSNPSQLRHDLVIHSDDSFHH